MAVVARQRRRGLTDKMVASLSRKPKRYIITDPEMRGHYVRVPPHGPVVFAAVARDPYAVAKKNAERTMAFYDTTESGAPAEVEDTGDWANFGDDNAPSRGDSDNTAFFEVRAVADSSRYYIEPEPPEETRIGPLLGEDDLSNCRLSENPHRYRTDTRPEDRSRLMSRIDSEPRIKCLSPEWFATNYPRRKRIDIITDDPVTSRLPMEGTYVAEGETLAPVESSELTSTELARASGHES